MSDSNQSPPNYKEIDLPEKCCVKCKSYTALSGYCSKYWEQVNTHGVCDSFAKKE